jgi:hypothetical protein
MTAPVITGGSITGVALSGNTFTNPVIIGGSINNTPIGASTASTGAFSTLSATGVTTVQAGSVSAPAITTTGDTNTGIFFPAADTIAFTEGGVEAMRIADTSNVGIGTTTPVSKFVVKTGTNQNFCVRAGSDVSGTGITLDCLNDANSAVVDLTLRGTNMDLYGAGSTPMVFRTNSTERMRITAVGELLIGTSTPLNDSTSNVQISAASGGSRYFSAGKGSDYGALLGYENGSGLGTGVMIRSVQTGDPIMFVTNNTVERMRIDSSGNLLVGKTSASNTTAGSMFIDPSSVTHYVSIVNTNVDNSSARLLYLNRQGSDGDLIQFLQATTQEGSISVSGTTVSYNGGHLSRWSQLPDGSKDETLLKGTILSNLDDMCVWEKDGVVAENEQLNKMKVSDVEGDTNVAGVFVNWTIDEDYGVDDMNVAMTGDMIIRIADGVVVQKGDLLMSAGDGTAMPQGDDIVRSKTIAKVTSNYVTCTYADGSYCVPCVLMAC